MKTPRVSRLTAPLGEAGYGPEAGPVGVLDTLARTGLPLPAGIVLTEAAHRAFLDAGTSGRLAGPLRETIREALIGLEARTVAVISARLTKGGLGSIPEVFEAVRELWWSMEVYGAVSHTWPIVIQREPDPERIISSSSSCSKGIGRLWPVRMDLSSAESISAMTLLAGAALREPVILGWGFEAGRWLLISAQPEVVT